MLQGKEFSISNGFENVTYNRKQIKGVGFANNGIENVYKVLLENNLPKINKNNYYISSSTFEAYSNFLSNKFITLIGTARDVARCKNRETNGSLGFCKYDFLGGYSDLIQYVGVNKNISKFKKDVCISFSNFLLSQNCQKDIKNYGLFSTTAINIYESDYMLEFEQVLKQPIKSVNVFTNFENIEKNKIEYFNKLFYN